MQNQVTVNYTSNKTPADYKCHQCGATGCKIWRAGFHFGSPKLLCVDCASTEEGIDKRTISADGTSQDTDIHSSIRTDCIGDYLPAIPSTDNTEYLHHNQSPEAYQWWVNLPLRK